MTQAVLLNDVSLPSPTSWYLRQAIDRGMNREEFVTLLRSLTDLSEEDMVVVLKAALTDWRFHKLCKCRKRAYKEKYGRTVSRKRGNLSKALTPAEIRVWKSFMPGWVAAAADLMLYCCIGLAELWNIEVVESLGVIRVRRQKTGVEKVLPIVDCMRQPLQQLGVIQSHSKQYVAKRFRMARERAAKAGYDKFGYVYGLSKRKPVAQGKDMIPQPLYLVTPHSFRHTATQALLNSRLLCEHNSEKQRVILALWRGDDVNGVGSHGPYMAGLVDPHTDLAPLIEDALFSFVDSKKRSGLGLWIPSDKELSL